MRRWWLLWALLTAGQFSAHAQRLIVIDQDGSGPGGSNQMAMLALLQAPDVRVLGITMVSGNAWEPEEVAHTLRTLELTGHADVPLAPGAVFPLVHDQQQAMADAGRFGELAWYGAWGDLARKTSGQPYHAPFVVPPLREGEPTLKPLDEDAAHFLIRQVRAHPHQVTVYAGGPLTNLALAGRIDPQFASLAKQLVLMGGSLNPQTADPEFATRPRHEFNFWWDAEAASIVLRSPWARITLIDTDVSLKTMFTHQMLAEIASSRSPTAQYLAKYTDDFYYLWDELAACVWLDPKLVSRERVLYLDVETARGPEYGDTLAWTDADKPGYTLQQVHVVDEVDLQAFYRQFTTLMKR
jgi:purine nucleosidase